MVIVSCDRTFDYRKLHIAFDAIWFHKRAILIATNPDRFCPSPGGPGEPDCAAIVAGVEASLRAQCQVAIGKPNPIMLQEALGDLDVDLNKVVMTGDRLHTDIAMAVNAGVPSAMTLPGEGSREEILESPPESRPTMVPDWVDKLLPRQIWEQNGWTKEPE